MNKSLNFIEMVDYLEINKNMTFNVVNKDSALEILKRYGYFNVITPFKYYFADKDNIARSQSLRIDGKHQYSIEYDFNDWYQKFLDERSRYPQIYKNVVEIKTAFKNVMFNSIYCSYNFANKNEFKDFILQDCRINAMNRYNNDEITYINCTLDYIAKEIDLTYSIYYLVGSIGFGDANNIFRCLDTDIQELIIHQLQDLNMAPRPSNPKDFYSRMIIMQKIRNCIMHNDSLEILFRFKIRNRNEYRNNKERLSYIKICKEVFNLNGNLNVLN